MQRSCRSFVVEVVSRRCCAVEALAFVGVVELGSFVAAVGCHSVERSCDRIEVSSIFRSRCSLGFDILDSAVVGERDSRSRMRQVAVDNLGSATGGRSCLVAADSGPAVQLVVEAWACCCRPHLNHYLVEEVEEQLIQACLLAFEQLAQARRVCCDQGALAM